MFTRYILPAMAIATLTFAVLQMTKSQQKPAPVTPAIEPAKSPYLKQLAGAGIVEPETENIAVGSHVPGIVSKVFVKVGELVEPDQRLFELDDRAQRAELEVRKSMQANAEAALKKLKDAPRREERPIYDAKVLEADVNLRDQMQQLARMKRLTGNSVSEEELDRRITAVELGKAQLAKAKGDFELWSAGTWKPDLDIAGAALSQAIAQRAQTEVELSRLTAKAPHARWKAGPNGTEVPDDGGVKYKVLQVSIRPGEYVGAAAGQALIVLGYVGKLHVRADIDENDIVRFRTNLVGVAKARGNPDAEFPLTFVRVEPYVIPKRSLTGANTERVDTRVLQVIYSIEAKGQSLYVGQQMDVFLNAGEK
jgi:HlyD family secretion protein